MLVRLRVYVYVFVFVFKCLAILRQPKIRYTLSRASNKVNYYGFADRSSSKRACESLSWRNFLRCTLASVKNNTEHAMKPIAPMMPTMNDQPDYD